MYLRLLLRAVNPYLGVVAVLVLLAALLGTMYFTWLELQWMAFLSGMLMAAVLAMVGRASRAERSSERRGEQVAVLRHHLRQETELRAHAETALAAARASLNHVDVDLPVMLAYIDSEQRVQYHNQAFREWGRAPAQVLGRHLREVLGSADYADMEAGIKEALSGRLVRFERTRRTDHRSLLRVSTQYVPRFNDGTVCGFYALLTDITSRSDALAAADEPAQAPPAGEQKAYTESLARQLTGRDDMSERLLAALDTDEFCLYAQTIVPVNPLPGVIQGFHEILIRLKEEERSLMPPGAFLPMAEEQGLLPELDRWVVNHLLDWVSGDPSRQEALYSVNISGATLGDAGFAAFVRESLRSHGLREGLLCIEFTESDAAARETDAQNLVHHLKEAGCRCALSQFGRSKVSFGLLTPLAVDFLKIDGNIILNMLRDRVALAKVKVITEVAHQLGMSTIAELVENEQTLAALRKVGVDYAQGFGIARPRPCEEISAVERPG